MGFLSSAVMSDGIGDLAEATGALLDRPLSGRVDFVFMDEPGEYRWRVRLIGDRVDIDVASFRGLEAVWSDRDGVALFGAQCTLRRFATQVRGQLRRLLDSFGEEGFRKRWGYPFPLSAYLRIEAALRR